MFFRRLFPAVAGLLAAVPAFADYPVAGHRYAADPTALVFDGRLYVYCSNDDENGTNGYVMSSITCISTDDLKNWTDHGVVFRANSTTWASLTWAPSAISNQNRVFLYFANGAATIGVATSSVPTGPFVDARGSALITGATPGASSPTQWLFDPGAFVDDDGQAYLYFGGQYPTNSRVIRLGANLTSVAGAAQPLDTPNFFEAAHLHKREGLYYLTYSTRPEAGMVIGCVTNTNPTNGFAPQGTVLPNPPQNVNNNNHHSIVAFGGQWYIVYHNRAAALANGLSNAEAVFKRSLCIDQITYLPDGSIAQTIPTVDGLAQLRPLDPYRRVEAETFAQSRGITTEPCAEGGMMLLAQANGAWVRVRGVDFRGGAGRFYARVASTNSGGTIELRLGATNGPLAGVCAVPATGGRQVWTTVTADVSGVSGTNDLYLRFTGSGAGELFGVNWWQFQYRPSSNAAVAAVVFEAESGTLGAQWAVNVSGSPAVTNIAITSNSTGSNPGSSARVATYSVTFPAPGTYHLYARLRVGPAAWDDDSLFFGNGFGAKSPTANADWVLVNGLAGAGFTNSADVVTGGGTLGAGMWKWVNLTLFSGHSGFTVPAGQLTQTLQIGGREDGLELDKFAFGPATQSYTVAALDAGQPGTPAPVGPWLSLAHTNPFQTIEGLGGAICFYNGWVRAHPYKEEIYQHAFAGLNLSMLRLGNWFRYQSNTNFDADAAEFVARANTLLGRPVPILMSSWSPPAFLKSNGQVGNGGTLLFTNGGFVYNEFAQYWYDALLAYQNLGVRPTWISIQNEPDWEASYDSCIFRPVEGFSNGTNWAGYSNALAAVYLKLTNLPAPPKLIAPEPVGIGYNVPQNYAATLNPAHFYGFGYHLYHGSANGTADGYISALRATTNLFPAKPKFMTEFGVSNLIESATLLHNTLTEGNVSGYNYWSLIWPWDGLGLVQIEFPWDPSRWTNAPPGTPTQSRGYWLSPAYWAMKHYSFFVTPGSRRVAVHAAAPDVRASAYLTEDGLRLVAVLIHRGTNAAATVDFDAGDFPFVESRLFQTAGTNQFRPLGQVGAQLTLPPESLTTVVLEKFVPVGPASDPDPAHLATGVGYTPLLGWMPGSNALTHAVYLGVNSNAVASATPASPEFRGLSTSNALAVVLSGGTTYFWRVDAIAGANTNRGAVWSFATAPLPALAHRFPFSETSGTNVANVTAGPAWNGWLPNGGTWTGGRLALNPASAQHVRLPAGIVAGLTNFTLEVWVRLNALSAWSRIVDFGSGTTTNLFLTPQSGAGGTLRFAITTGGAGGEQRINAPTALSTGAWHHVAVTLNGNVGTLYLNGAPVGTNNSMTLRPASLGLTVSNYFGRSQYADPHLNGELDEVRIHSVALSAAEIAASHALGPNQLLSAEPPVLTATPTGPNLELTWPLASAGYRVEWRTNLTTGAWTPLATPPPQLTNGAWRVTLPLAPDTPQTFYRLAR